MLPRSGNERGRPKCSGEEPVTVRLCPSEISHWLTWDKTRTPVSKGRWVTVWVMARNLEAVMWRDFEAFLFHVAETLRFLGGVCKWRSVTDGHGHSFLCKEGIKQLLFGAVPWIKQFPVEIRLRSRAIPYICGGQSGSVCQASQGSVVGFSL